MYDYGQLVYLDNQKTGSSYVAKFLEVCCSLPIVDHGRPLKHHPVRNRFKKGAIYFSTVRRPTDLYSSLFRFGRDRKGVTWQRFDAIGKLFLYEDYAKWLEFVLDESNAEVFKEGYPNVASIGIGLMSYRFMRVTLQHPVSALQDCQTADEAIAVWKKKNLAKYVFKQEDLNERLLEFATKTYPQFFKKPKVEKFLQSDQKINVTRTKADLTIPKELRDRLLEREKLLVQEYYADDFVGA